MLCLSAAIGVLELLAAFVLVNFHAVGCGVVVVSSRTRVVFSCLLPRCRPMDVDLWNHMNNARYARKFEWGRHHFLQRTGLHRAMATIPPPPPSSGNPGDGALGPAKSGSSRRRRRGVHYGFGTQAIRYRREVNSGGGMDACHQLCGMFSACQLRWLRACSVNANVFVVVFFV